MIFHQSEKRIPLHCLVVAGHADHAEIERIKKLFPPHEVIIVDNLRWELVGDDHSRDLNRIIDAELRHRVALKLSLGERVVVVFSKSNVDQRSRLVKSAKAQSANIIYLKTSFMGDKNYLSGDGSITVLDKISSNDIVSDKTFKPTKWNGVTIIGDVHGMARPLERAVAWANSRNHYIWLLGDVIDSGPDTLRALDIVYDVIMNGRGNLLIGNHERKIARWLAQQDSDIGNVKLSEANLVTVNALNALDYGKQREWIGRFKSVLAKASLVNGFGNVTCAHGALHSSYWMDDPDDALIERLALYGEIDQSSQPNYRLSYRWVDAVPDGENVFVGHDCRSNFPTVVTGASGGKVIFLDTGCGKGGQLSSVDLRLENDGLVMECFNMHGAE